MERFASFLETVYEKYQFITKISYDEVSYHSILYMNWPLNQHNHNFLKLRNLSSCKLGKKPNISKILIFHMLCMYINKNCSEFDFYVRLANKNSGQFCQEKGICEYISRSIVIIYGQNL